MMLFAAGGGALWTRPEFFILIGLIIFLYIAYRLGWKLVMGALDQRANNIKAQIEEAERLREEAKTLLADYKEKHARAMEEAEALVDSAKQDAKRLSEAASAELEASLVRREAAAAQRLNQMEEAARARVRDAAVEAATTALTRLLAEQSDSKAATDLMDRAIADTSTKLH